jgi:hypothetical protein
VSQELRPTISGLDGYTIFQNENTIIPYNLHLLGCNDQLAGTDIHFRDTTLLHNVSNHLPAEMAHTRKPELKKKKQLSQPTANTGTYT